MRFMSLSACGSIGGFTSAPSADRAPRPASVQATKTGRRLWVVRLIVRLVSFIDSSVYVLHVQAGPTTIIQQSAFSIRHPTKITLRVRLNRCHGAKPYRGFLRVSVETTGNRHSVIREYAVEKLGTETVVGLDGFADDRVGIDPAPEILHHGQFCVFQFLVDFEEMPH